MKSINTEIIRDLADLQYAHTNHGGLYYSIYTHYIALNFI